LLKVKSASGIGKVPARRAIAESTREFPMGIWIPPNSLGEFLASPSALDGYGGSVNSCITTKYLLPVAACLYRCIQTRGCSKVPGSFFRLSWPLFFPSAGSSVSFSSARLYYLARKRSPKQHVTNASRERSYARSQDLAMLESFILRRRVAWTVVANAIVDAGMRLWKLSNYGEKKAAPFSETYFP